MCYIRSYQSLDFCKDIDISTIRFIIKVWKWNFSQFKFSNFQRFLLRVKICLHSLRMSILSIWKTVKTFRLHDFAQCVCVVSISMYNKYVYRARCAWCFEWCLSMASRRRDMISIIQNIMHTESRYLNYFPYLIEP